MKYHIGTKILALLLCAVMLTAILASTAAVIGIAQVGLYENTVEQLKSKEEMAQLEGLAQTLANRFAAERMGKLDQKLLDKIYGKEQPGWLVGAWYYTVEDAKGNLLKTNVLADDSIQRYGFEVQSTYPVLLWYSADGQQQPTPEKDPAGSAPSENHWTLTYTENGVEHSCTMADAIGPTYHVTLYLAAGAMAQNRDWTWQLVELGAQNRYSAIAVLVVCAVLFVLLRIYLCKAAGRKTGSDEIHPGGLNRIPLDLYAAAAVGSVLLALPAVKMTVAELSEKTLVSTAWTLLGLAFAVCLVVVGFLFAFAAQVKTKGGYWWRKSLIGMLLRLIYRFLRMLSLTWQWLLIAAVLGGLVALSVVKGSQTGLVISLAACAAVIIYVASCFGKLMEGVRRMSRGDFNGKVSSVMMVGNFRRFAMDLNSLADGALEAAKRETTSERMKAELVTNISHDIKTPLTSIINYVDLLKRAENEQQRQQYLEVLSRQSQQMKKLIDDLVEMSKATSGAMTCELAPMDASEAVNQALGEFADKLQQAGLSPLVRYPQSPAVMMADGQLIWRVMSNLLTNAVKYAMPGTRLYVDIYQQDGNVNISLKNVSKEVLPAGGGELMERFVRGDASRNTEGSGLGLNIARSLMELQGGQLQLWVDGDLFKVTMTLPEAK